MRVRLLVAAGVLAAVACVSGFEPPKAPWSPPIGPARPALPAERAPCTHHDPVRAAWFGDLHIHSGFSMDARIRDLLSTPGDAYRYARGESAWLPPLDASGRGSREVRIDRPLDFAAVTDHAEWLGEVRLCTRPGSPTYDSESCRTYRGEREVAMGRLAGSISGPLSALPGRDGRNAEICGAGATRCREESVAAWQINQAAAENFYDRSSECRFTTFHAWEHTAVPEYSKVHRNVILRNEIGPELPISSIEAPSAEELFDRLEALCLENGSGCDALTIPHNPNLSNGRLFQLTYRDETLETQRARARQRATIEPLVEMMQVKGESECRNGLFDVVGDADEFCDFEKLRGLGDESPADCREGIGAGALAGRGCVSRLDYARYVLIEGLRESQRIGVNPFRLGFIGSTDTHNGIPGAVAENSYPGSSGDREATASQRLARTGPGQSNPARRNPGGLVGVWAEENSRESIFAALRRRETFATSGPRIVPRFFAGFDLPSEICDDPNLAKTGYGRGVPMGATLPAAPAPDATPTFVASAVADSAGARGLLQRIQIVKGWVGDDGRFHQALHDVAGGANDSGVDLETCTPNGSGHLTLCSTWSDPDFDPERPAVYYARIVENPSCRWSSWQCRAFAPSERPPACSDPGVPEVIQERAWTSPIWFDPAAG